MLSRDEQKRLAVYLLDGTDFCKFGVLLMLFTGLRIGELCTLRWSDVNIKEKVISVSATMQRLRSTDTDTAEKTKILIGAPKSDTSVRTIPLTDYAATLCRQFAVRNAATCSALVRAVSPAGSVSASAFGRGVRRTPTPLKPFERRILWI